MPRIHPTAIVDPEARLGDDVEVGPYSIIEGDVVLGSGTVLRSHVTIRRYTTMGTGNFVDSFASLGGSLRTTTSTMARRRTCGSATTMSSARV